MSKVITNNITPRSGSSVGLTGDLTASGNITGVGGTFSGPVSGTTGTFTGNVSVGGTITYEDVTNVDSVGIITARSDVSIADKIIHTGDTNTAIRFPAADTFTVETGGSEAIRVDSSGNITLGYAGNSLHFKNGFNNSTARIQNGGGSNSSNLKFLVKNAGTEAEALRITSAGTTIFKAGLAEKVNVKTQLTSANACAITDGNVILTTGNEPGNTYPDITGVHSVLSSGEGFSVTIALKVNGSGTINAFRIDGVAQTLEWSGGSAPSAGSSGYDVFTFSAFKTGSGTTNYTVFGAATNYA